MKKMIKININRCFFFSFLHFSFCDNVIINRLEKLLFKVDKLDLMKKYFTKMNDIHKLQYLGEEEIDKNDENKQFLIEMERRMENRILPSKSYMIKFDINMKSKSIHQEMYNLIQIKTNEYIKSKSQIIEEEGIIEISKSYENFKDSPDFLVYLKQNTNLNIVNDYFLENGILVNRNTKEKNKLYEFKEGFRLIEILDNKISLKLNFVIKKKIQEILKKITSTDNILRIFVDGGCKHTTRTGYIGATFYLNNTNLLQITGNIGDESTNSTAEYFSFIISLIFMDFLDFNFKTYIFSDSEFMVKQINKKYKVKTSHIVFLNEIVTFFIKAKSYLTKIDPINIKVLHVKRNFNQEADYLTNISPQKASNQITLLL